jgi:NADPH:quinone reductase
MERYTPPMRAIVVRQFGEPEELRLADIPDPQPSPGQVVVRLHAAGVNPYEAYIRSGKYARLPELPYTPGSDGAGIVESVGAGVTTVAPGARVYVAATIGRAGTYAERIACDSSMVHPLPESLSFSQGAAIGVPAATAYRALVIRANARAGETVLVHGASGGVGIAAVQFARGYGLRVIGTAGSAEGLDAARRAGAGQVLNHREEGYLSKIPELTGGKGVDIILEMLANMNLDRDLGVLAPKGRVIVIGNRGRVEIDARQTLAKESAILGMQLWAATPEETRQTHAAIGAALASGVLKPVVGRELPLEAAPEAHRAVLENSATGKIVLTM